MAERPGTMIYFDDLLPLFNLLSDEESGRLFRAIVLYGKFGEVPDFSQTPTIAVAWGFIRPKIDRDGNKYQQEVNQRRYAVYCREIRKTGVDPLPFDEWYQELSTDDFRHPTGTATETAPGTETSFGTASRIVDGGGMEEHAVNLPPPSLSRAEEYFRKMIDNLPSSSSMERLRAFETELGSEVCVRAIDAAVDAGKRSWNYVSAVLSAKQEAGVRSLEDWDRAEAERQERKTKDSDFLSHPVDGQGYTMPQDLGDLDLLIEQGLVPSLGG